MILTLNIDKKNRKLSESRKKWKILNSGKSRNILMDPELTPDQQATRIKTIRNFVMLYGQPPFLMYAATYQRDSKYSTVLHSTVQYGTGAGL